MCSYATILVINLIMFFPLADDWKLDQIRWNSDAIHFLPKKIQFFKSNINYVLDTENGPSRDFKKHVYQLLDLNKDR